MRCDEVFQHLTRAGGHSTANGQLERHLAECRSCRETAELFRPAVALFETGGRDDESGEVPAAWRRVWEAVSVAEQAGAQLRGRERVGGGWWRRYGWPACTAAALLIGVLTGVVMGNWGEGAERQAGVVPEVAGRRGGVSCELLMAVLREADGEGVCPTCRRRVEREKTEFVALCAACHLPAGGARAAGVVNLDG